MANVGTVDKSFQKLVKARKSYRQRVEELSFPAYSDVVTPELHKTTGLEAIVKGARNANALAVQQQALDYMIASKRAVDMRNKTFLDYVRDSKNARPQYDTYEDSRVSRYEHNHF